MFEVDSKPAHELFADFIERHGLTLLRAAEALHITKPAIWFLREGKRTPSPPLAEAIERWTGGEVPASAWPRNADEIARLDAWSEMGPHEVIRPPPPSDADPEAPTHPDHAVTGDTEPPASSHSDVGLSDSIEPDGLAS